MESIPVAGCYLYFNLRSGADTRAGLEKLQQIADGNQTVVGIGQSLLSSLGKNLSLLPQFPSMSCNGIDIPSTPAALWCWLRGSDRGELLHLSRKISAQISDEFSLLTSIDTFRYDSGLDLTGYEDGTENPQGQAAIDAAIVQDDSDISGSSIVAVQKWQHNLDSFQSMSRSQQDDTFGRRLSDNVELDDAPESAHVKRTAQESFSPEAFMLRRSMPWAEACVQGLVFVAFASSSYAFEVQLKRMIGADDGIVDALFNFSRPLSGSYFWCPGMKDGSLDLKFIGV